MAEWQPGRVGSEPTPTQPLPPVLDLPIIPARPWWTLPPEEFGLPAEPPGVPARRLPPRAQPPAAGARRRARTAVAQAGRRRAWTVLGAMSGVAVLSAVAIAWTLPDPPVSSDQAQAPSRLHQTAASRATNRTGPAPSTPAPGVPADLTALDAGRAAELLGSAGAGLDGSIETAWTWSDRTGTHLVASLRAVTARPDGAPGSVSLRVVLLSGIDSSHPTVVNRARDPGLRCQQDEALAADFSPDAFAVRDLDGNGSAEVTVGWAVRCGPDANLTRARLALMSGTSLFVLRGPGSAGAGPTPAPSAADWPSAFLDVALAGYSRAYLS